MKYAVAFLIGSLAGLLSNRGVAVFNDGLRPIFPEYLEGRIERKALFKNSFALSFALIVGFGTPFSLTSQIILIHCVLLGTDIIGTAFKDDKKGGLLSAILGGFYGLLITFGLNGVFELFGKLPFNFTPSLAKIGVPIVIAFSVFPSLVIGYRYGFKNGIISFIVIIIVRQLTQRYGVLDINGRDFHLNPDLAALLIGMSMMLILAARDKNAGENSGANQTLLNIFAERVKRIKRNSMALSLMGGLISSAVSLGLLAGDPLTLNLLSNEKISEAGFIALARTLGFIPLITTTAITTGVYAPTGMAFVFAAGIFIRNPFAAFILGCAVIIFEILALEGIAKAFDKFPAIRACGDSVRTSLSKVLELSIFAGSMLAAGEMAPRIGYLFVIGIYALNRVSKKPFMDMAMAPISVIALGLLINLMRFIGIY